ncbi:M50 family metallopeptidase [Nonomuraea roseoviolacea]|uniref:Membrane-associated protease RseP (Regulator of RpoE activity) n=1 Tax=Nonomuraea roseoviolacea subsp. carminata TaxID=160689 RepID=A0ABT1K6C7_9ACTN|nr:site-2 protease family protein [Nonomuraea roseoviolacea]MCP2349465.1 membrane-associated protease RseP (regulator of RpoE activity) [Nonomuraea roseoviolacea subsp. carminata]
MNWLFVAGIAVFFLGLMASIALHELGHLVPAKIFGVRVPQYMVGFGATAWSIRRGETEYGIKWIPLGGYIRMIGMLPPRPGDAPGKLRGTSTGPFQGLIETAREASMEEVRPGDEDRVFYRKKWWQKVIIMSGGPAMNFVLSFILFSILLVGIGLPTYAPIVSPQTNTCVIPASEKRADCRPTDQPTPAAKAGLKPGDRIVSFDGQKIATWDDATRLIRGHGAGTVSLGIVRAGKPMTLPVTLIAQDRPSLTDPNKIDKGVGFLGVLPDRVMEKQSFGMVVGYMGELTGRVAGSLLNLPEKMVGIWHAAFSGQERDPEGPVGVVGAGRLGGEILSSDMTTEMKIFNVVNLLAGFNLAIGMFNLIPLLPLDGGHIAGGLWEGLKRGFARITRRPEPAYVDIAKVLPLTYTLALVMIVMAGLLVYADLFNPLKLAG